MSDAIEYLQEMLDPPGSPPKDKIDGTLAIAYAIALAGERIGNALDKVAKELAGGGRMSDQVIAEALQDIGRSIIQAGNTN